MERALPARVKMVTGALENETTNDRRKERRKIK